MASMSLGLVKDDCRPLKFKFHADWSELHSVPHGLVVRNGKIIGATHGLIAGDFFDNLRTEITLLHSPSHEAAGLAFTGNVTL